MLINGTKKAYKWLKENTSLDSDTMMLDFEQLAYAVKHGILIQVGDTETFLPRTFENDWGEYEITEAYRVPDEVIKEHLLVYPYRYKARLVKESEAFRNLDDIVKAQLRNVDNAITSIADYSVVNASLKAAAV